MTKGRFSERLALLLLAVAGLSSATVLIVYFAEYGNWFIHPHQFEIHLPQLLAGGPEIGLRSFLNIFRQFDPTESRPRFLAYAIIWANLNLRMGLYDFFVLYPPFSIAWVLELLVGPCLLFRLVRNMSGSNAAGWVALIVYVTSIGFLSGFAMALMPSKPLTNVVFIATLWLLSEAKHAATRGHLLHEVPHGRRYAIALGVVLLAGLFLDEVPLFAYLLPLLFYGELFFPSRLDRAELGRTRRAWLPLIVPPLLFLFLVVLIVPPVTQKLFGYRFDLIGSVLVNREAAESGKTFFSGKDYGFGWESLVSNFASLIGTALVPWRIAPLAAHPAGGGVVTGMQLSAGLVGISVLFLTVALLLGLKGRRPAAPYLLRTSGCALLFILFMSVLSGRHVPFITGYVYGCGLAVFLAMIVGLGFAAVASARARAAVVVCAVYMGVIQLINFDAINKDWIVVHNEKLTRPSYEKTLPIAQDGRATTRQEINAIWEAWRRGELETYLSRNVISSGSVFLIFELRHLDKRRAAKR